MLVYLALAVAFGYLLIPRLSSWVLRQPVSEGILAFVIVATLFYAWTAEVLGEIAAITGAFLAGLMFGRTSVRRQVAEGMHTLTFAFFVPIFLISIGLRTNARSLDGEALFFALAILLVAVAGKIGGCFFGARAGGFDAREALRVGTGMVSRGEVGLIIAAIGLTGGWIDQAIYSITVVMVLATTIITPFLLRLVFPRGQPQEGAVAQPAPGVE
jgi:Kef-type K+ transport system membrane component KefB